MLERATGIRDNGLEIERTSNVGLAIVIIAFDPSRNGENITQPKLWTNIEKKSKPATGRIAGQISLPGESRKIGKSMKDALAGGIVGEFTGSKHLIENNLFVTPSWFIRSKIHVEGNLFDLAFLVFRGSLSQEINPLDANEVEPHGWMTGEEIQEKDPQKDPRIVRSFVHQVLDLQRSEKSITKVVLECERGLLVPVSSMLPEIQSPKQFFETREKARDILDLRNGSQ